MTVNTIGQRQAELALQQGALFSPQQALSVGWVDNVVPDDQVMTAAQKEMARWLKIPGMAEGLK